MAFNQEHNSSIRKFVSNLTVDEKKELYDILYNDLFDRYWFENNHDVFNMIRLAEISIKHNYPGAKVHYSCYDEKSKNIEYLVHYSKSIRVGNLHTIEYMTRLRLKDAYDSLYLLLNDAVKVYLTKHGSITDIKNKKGKEIHIETFLCYTKSKKLLKSFPRKMIPLKIMYSIKLFGIIDNKEIEINDDTVAEVNALAIANVQIDENF